MKRVLFLSLAAAIAVAPAPSAVAASSASANATASVTIVQSASIQVVSDMTLPVLSALGTTAIAGAPSQGGRSGSGSSATSATATTVTAVSNAALTIVGQSGDTVSMAVPTSFEVIRSGGTESLTVKTNTNSKFGVDANGVVVGASPQTNTMSVNVGGDLAVASEDRLVPGPYEGLLVVVVQYN